MKTTTTAATIGSIIGATAGCFVSPLLLSLALGMLKRSLPREATGGCRKCGYDVRGIRSDCCPECGTPLSKPEA